MKGSAPIVGGSRSHVDPLRIVLVGPARFGVGEPYAGGLESFIDGLGRGLTERGHRVTNIAGVAPGGCPAPGARSDVACDDEAFAGDERAVLRALDMLLVDERPDVIHNNSPYPGVFDQDSATSSFVTTFHTPPLAPLVARLHSETTPRGRVLVTPSSINARQWAAQGVRTSTVLNGVDRRVFAAGPGTGGYLVWTGRLVPEKGAHLAIDAAALLEMPLFLAGPLHDQEYWSAEIAPRLHHRARYVGHLGRRATARLVGMAAASLVTPQWDEPFGLVVAESLSCGTPVAGIARGALPELLSADVAALSDTSLPAHLAEATLRAVTLDRAACRRASSRFSIDRMVDDYLDLYLGRTHLPEPFCGRAVRLDEHRF